jgi:hypothetical protein
MADERSVFPGDGESPGDSAPRRGSGRWLDRATAERLLRGDAPDNAVDPAHRDEAERLARTLGALAALSAEPAPADEELPGEAAALAAFRKARAERAVEPATSADFGAEPAGETAASAAFRRARAEGEDGTAEPAASADPRAGYDGDGGLIHIGGRATAHGRPRRRHPARLALAAALTVGMVGGVAAAAGTGILPTPFDTADPGPAVSVSGAATPGPHRPLVSPSPGASADGGPEAATPDGSVSGPPAPNAEGNAKGTGNDWPAGMTSACRDVRDGRTLDAKRRRTLEGEAGGSTHVPAYCAQVLETPSGQGPGSGTHEGAGREEQSGPNAGKYGRGDEGGTGGAKAKKDEKGEKNKREKDAKDDKGAGSGGTGPGGTASGTSGFAGTSGTPGDEGASDASPDTVHRQNGGVGASPAPTYSTL